MRLHNAVGSILIMLSLFVLVGCYHDTKYDKYLTVTDARNMLHKYSNEKDLQSDVDVLFKLYDDKEFKVLYELELINAPSLSKFVEMTNKNEKSICIIPKDQQNNMPGFIQIRYGTDHFHYQYIIIFRTGADLSLVHKQYQQISRYIYFLP